MKSNEVVILPPESPPVSTRSRNPTEFKIGRAIDTSGIDRSVNHSYSIVTK